MTTDDLDLVPVEDLLDALARRYEHVVFMGVGEDRKFRSHINTTDYVTALGAAHLLAARVLANIGTIDDVEGI